MRALIVILFIMTGLGEVFAGYTVQYEYRAHAPDMAIAFVAMFIALVVLNYLLAVRLGRRTR